MADDPDLEEQASPEADRLLADWQAFKEQLIRKYGGDPSELPFEDWVVFNELKERGASLTIAEQRYICKRWGLPSQYATFMFHR